MASLGVKRIFCLCGAIILPFIPVVLGAGCTEKGVERPVGFFKLGSVAELATHDETYFPEIKILLRHDSQGFFVMSTACTYDGSPLSRVTPSQAAPDGERWVSSYTSSKYDSAGRVLHGPAKENLPYYDLRLDSLVYGGPKDTLYVHVGVVRQPEWRFTP